MEGDIPEETAMRRSDLGAVLSELPLFQGLDYAFLREIALAAQWLSLPGGATLFSAGDPADESAHEHRYGGDDHVDGHESHSLPKKDRT